MPRPKPKGGFTVPPVAGAQKPAKELGFIVNLDVGDKGEFGFPCGDGTQPVSWLHGKIQNFFTRMKAAIDPDGPDPIVEALLDSKGAEISLDAKICDVLQPGGSVTPVFHFGEVGSDSGEGDDTAEAEQTKEHSSTNVQPEKSSRASGESSRASKETSRSAAESSRASGESSRAPGKGARPSGKGSRASGAEVEGVAEHLRTSPLLEEGGASTLRIYSEAPHAQAAGHASRVFDLSFAPGSGGSLVASASDDDTARVWRLAADGGSYEQSALLRGHTDSVLRVNWSPDGSMLATGSADTCARLWRPNPNSGDDGLAMEATCISIFEGHAEEVYACEFVINAMAPQLVTASTTSLSLWDLETGARLCETPELPLEIPADAGQEMPNRWKPGHIFCTRQQAGGGRLFAASCSDGAMRLYTLDGSNLKGIAAVPMHGAISTACAWHPNGFQIGSVSTDGTILVLDIRTGGLVWNTKSRGPVFGCTWVPGPGHVLAACGMANAVALMDTGVGSGRSAGNPKSRLPQSRVLHADTVPNRMLLCVAASDDGSCIAGSGDVPVSDADGVCLDPCCVPPPRYQAPSPDADEDPDGLFSAPAASREGRIVFDEPETPTHDPDAPRTVPLSPIHVWRARAARLNGIA